MPFEVRPLKTKRWTENKPKLNIRLHQWVSELMSIREEVSEWLMTEWLTDWVGSEWVTKWKCKGS